MPILAAIPELWPEGALEEPEDSPDSTKVWVALRVQSRCEKMVAQQLMRREFGYYLCLRSVPRVYQRRRVVSQIPLFPGYVFAAAKDPEQLQSLWSLRHVSRLLHPPDTLKLIQELRSLHRLLTSGTPVTPEEQLQAGHRARIIRGCLAGLEGTVLINRGGMRLMLAVSLLGRGASIEVTPDMVQKL